MLCKEKIGVYNYHVFIQQAKDKRYLTGVSMLKLLRKKKVSKRIFYGLAILIIPAFVIWGSSSVINKSKVPSYAGIIFGRKISFDDFRDAQDAWKTQLKLQYGDKAQEAATTLFNPTQAAWDRLILLHEVSQRGIHIKDKELIDTITRFSFLQKDGRFDPQTYDLFLKYSLGEYPRVFEEHLRQNLAMATVFEQVTADTRVSDEEVKKAYEEQNVQARIKYVFFPSQGYKDKIPLIDEESKKYYESNKDKFKIPPQINAIYLRLDYKEDMPQEEKTKISETMKTALKVARQKGLSEAAKELHLDAKETGLFGFDDPIPHLGWMPQLSTILFSLEANSLSKIIEDNRGVSLFQIKEKKDAYIPEFIAAKDKVKDALLSGRSKETARQKAKDFLAQAKTPSVSFEKAAEGAGLQIKETPRFSREEYIPELGMAQPLKDVAFKLKPEAVADDIVELEQGFYVLKCAETVPLDEEKFKKEKDEFSKQILEQKRNKVFNDFFEGLKKRARLINYIPETK
jgi:peptidyl-prolyl cis-trans isomerase D